MLSYSLGLESSTLCADVMGTKGVGRGRLTSSQCVSTLDVTREKYLEVDEGLLLANSHGQGGVRKRIRLPLQVPC